MNNCSASNIHRRLKIDKPLSVFINEEKNIFDQKRRDGIIPDGMDFLTYLNIRYKKQLNPESNENATGKEVKKPLADILKQTAEKLKSEAIPVSEPINTVKVKKTILGMNPIVFYSATGAIVIVTGVLIYKMVKK